MLSPMIWKGGKWSWKPNLGIESWYSNVGFGHIHSNWRLALIFKFMLYTNLLTWIYFPMLVKASTCYFLTVPCVYGDFCFGSPIQHVLRGLHTSLQHVSSFEYDLNLTAYRKTYLVSIIFVYSIYLFFRLLSYHIFELYTFTIVVAVLWILVSERSDCVYLSYATCCEICMYICIYAHKMMDG